MQNMAGEKKAPWTEDQIAIAKAIMSMHGLPLEDFNPVQPSEEFMEFVRGLTTPQLQWLMMEILATIHEKTKHLHGE
jgi:hypothetical protein